MARTQSADYDKRREVIINRAATLYAKHGFLGASVADLAKACKASKSLIYHYYPSKEDVLYGVMCAHLEDLVTISEDVMAPLGIPPVERLTSLTIGFMQAYVGAASSHKVLLNELDNLPADKRKLIVARQREVIVTVEKLLLEIRPELQDRPDLQRPISMLFFGMINWTHTWFNPKGSVSARNFALLAVELMLKGLHDINLGHQPS